MQNNFVYAFDGTSYFFGDCTVALFEKLQMLVNTNLTDTEGIKDILECSKLIFEISLGDENTKSKLKKAMKMSTLEEITVFVLKYYRYFIEIRSKKN